MNLVENYYKLHHFIFSKTDVISGLGPLLLRLYLVPVFWIAGNNKIDGFDNVVEWFGNDDWGLGLPFPVVFAVLAFGTEIVGAIFLLFGFAVRWISVPLVVVMLVAIFSVHWDHGWQATHDLMSFGVTENTHEAIDRLQKAREILQEYGNYDWLTEKGNIVMSNNGMEWAVTYMIMLISLFFTGGGKYFSVDYYLNRYFSKTNG